MWLTPALSAALQEHARARYPEECVGALLQAPSGEVTARPLANAAARPTRAFEVSAREYLNVEAEAERAGLRLVGFYHSHPDGEAVPSTTDLASAWAEWWMVIVPVTATAAGAPRAWRLVEERGEERGVTRLVSRTRTV